MKMGRGQSEDGKRKELIIWEEERVKMYGGKSENVTKIE